MDFAASCLRTEGHNETYADFLESFARTTPDAVAILAPGRSPMSWRDVWIQICSIAKNVNSMGFGRGDRIAMVLSNGSEAAIALMGIMACATAIPLNPKSHDSELAAFLSRSPLGAVIVDSKDSPAVPIARGRGLRLIELPHLGISPPGVSQSSDSCSDEFPIGVRAQPSDIAVVLQTSGTSALPKFVPLSQRNILAGAVSVQTTYRLTSDDRCLHFMPIFHAHGLIRTLLSPLLAGGSVVCTSGFDAMQFFDWLRDFKTTWYSAVPTIHKAIVTQATLHGGNVGGLQLRFIVSGSAPLPDDLINKLEELFNAPLVQGYGLTETSCQGTSNPLPPGERRRGSVGTAVGAEVAIIGAADQFLGRNQIGEVALRGPGVMSGYEGSSKEERPPFLYDWFRTGDLGFRDTDGYLFIAGRIKEIINRGGEKISVNEVDQVVNEHPAVLDAVTFPVPHPSLGEDVAVAVVVQKGEQVTERQIRDFAAARLARHKVPRRIIFIDHIPRGATEKPLRADLAKRFAQLTINRQNEKNPEHQPSETQIEQSLKTIWEEVLEIKGIGIHEDFFQLGGDSIRAMRIVSRVVKVHDVQPSLSDFFERPTIGELASLVEVMVRERDAARL